ncbi:glycosyltransferase family 39 protein, partial [Candidatus Curtissbacteria bacterium]|nr:glycosyltransferase family 39 protein [Candidatus Curtissbacteria bacterium]
LSSLTPVAIFLLGGELVGLFSAFSAAVLYSLTPVIIGVDRWVFHDSILALFSFLATGLFIIDIKKKKFSLLPGIFLGLAFLSKIIGIFSFLPWLVLIIGKKNRQFVVKMILFNLASALATILIVWPESWRRPVISIFEYTLKIVKLPGDETPNYYFGKSTLNPGPTYYFFQLFARLPEIIFFLFGFAFLQITKARKKVTLPIIAIILYCLVFFVFMSLIPLKTSFRYLLPILPWFYLLIGNYISRALLVIAIGLLMISNIYYHPDYYVYYNQLVGGPKNAANFDQVPLCYASKSALTYLNENKIQGTIYIAGCEAGEPYYNSGRVFTKNHEEAKIVIVGTELRQKDPAKLEKILKYRHLIHKIIVKESPVGEIWLKN